MSDRDLATDVVPDPNELPGFKVCGGIRVASIGEDGDVLLIGHHDPDAAWSAFADYQVHMGYWATVEDEPREDYQVRQAHAAFSRHSEGCEDQAPEVCAACAAEDHDSCAPPCLCEDDYDHDDEGPSATPVPCTCDEEYAWWVSESKTGEPVTWIIYDWTAARERRNQTECTCTPRPGREAPDSRGCARHPILAALDEAAAQRANTPVSPTQGGDA